MPCYRCAARQTDPARGASPWKRGVVADSMVLVCPDCQRAHDWTAELDRCAACGSTALVRALGETRCRACGHAGAGVRAVPAVPPVPAGAPDSAADPDAGSNAGPDPGSNTGPGPGSNTGPGPGPAPPGSDPGLGAEVSAALDRLLGRDAP